MPASMKSANCAARCTPPNPSDDRIAEKAYEVIFKCRRGERL
jgi:hypothetical protein